MEKTMPCVLASLIFEIPISLSEDEDDASSEEEEEMLIILAVKRSEAPQRIENYVEVTVPHLTAQQFQQHFRITIDAYENLLHLIGPQLQKQISTGRPTINIEKQLLSVLWLLATPDCYRSVGERFNLAKSSLSMCFVRVVEVLNSLAPTVIKWPEAGQRMEEIKRKFYLFAKLHNVIGAVDGTFIEIKAPKEDPQSYITRKCNYAFTLQAITDSFLRFTDVFMGYPGSVSDTRIFRNSDVYRAVMNDTELYFPENELIIGDKAYPVLPWCIPPYINRGNLTPAQRYFNTVHAKTRQCVERAFGLLFGRFRRLKYLDMNRTDLIPGTVLAACVLHNVCLNFGDLLIEEYIREGINHVRHNEDVENLENHNDMAGEGRIRRDEICREVYANRNNRQ